MGRAVGRTFKVTGKQIRSYEPVSAPRGRTRMKANPIGVTTLAQVNGRGAASARVAARGKSRSQRLSHARELLGGSSMKKNRSRAAFVRPKKATAKKVKMTANAKKAAGKRLAAYNSARKRGLSEKSAARSALRKAPFTANERSRGVTFKGSKARKMRPNRSSTVGGGGSAYAEGWEQAFGGGSSSTQTSTPKKKKAKSMAGKKKKGAAKSKSKKKKAKRKSTPAQFRTVKKTVKTKKRVAFGQYKRVKLLNPRTGKYEYSYMYRTKSGKMRRIPTDAVLRDASGKSSSVKAKRKMDAARKRAADRILKEGGAFVPNAKKKRTRATLRRNYFNKLLRAGESKASAKGKAMRKFPYTVSEKNRDYKFEPGVGKKRKKTKSKTKRKGTKRKATKRTKTKRKATKRTTAKRKGTKRKSSKRKGTKRKATKRKGTKRKGTKRKGTKRKGTKRKSSTKRKAKMRKNGRKKMRTNGRRRGRYTMNSFMADMKMVLKSGALIATGFLVHRVLTSLAAEYLLGPVISPKDAEPNLALKKWEKPIAGAVVATAGIALTGAAIKGPERVMIGGGMLASLFQSFVVSALMAADQPQVASRLEGYSNSMAYQLRGRRRRGMGAMTSIMPRYAQLSGFQQAAAGYEQAAAGFGGGSMGRRGTGEYFTGTAGFMQAAAGTGEYFAAPSLKGVGGYEPAGPLVMQASAGVGQKPIDDGIRPDTNLDRVLDLAESAAGVGEYLTAQPDNGGWAEDRVPTQSQWIPNGPLWAGELKVKGNVESSELPAGILAMPGGNGILS